MHFWKETTVFIYYKIWMKSKENWNVMKFVLGSFKPIYQDHRGKHVNFTVLKKHIIL